MSPELKQSLLVKHGELSHISAELSRGNKEIHRSLKSLNGWANRVLKNLHIDDYADYPQPSKGNF